jgi:hypothetical protein
MINTNQLQAELVSDIQRLLLEGTGSIEIVSQQGRRLTLSVTPTAVYPLKSRVDDLPFLNERE